jgi:site-specific DNA-methyltransferase (adenine-specific)
LRAVILHGDNLPLLRELEAGTVQMVYADPPFNPGRTQARKTLATVASTAGDRTGFGGRRYATTLLQESSYRDVFDDYLGFLEPRLVEIRRVLAPEGTLYLHLDYREAHYAKLLLDELFGRECFLNELIWAYDYGAKPRSRWRSTASRTWRRASSRRSNASAVSGPRASCGTRSSLPPAARRPATRRRNPRA